MKIVVFGATGRTGREVVRAARQRNHEVVAAARTAPQHPWAQDVVARSVDVGDLDAVTDVLDGADAVVFAVGVGTSRRPTTVYSHGVDNVLAVMSNYDVTLSVISALPAAPPEALSRGQRLVARMLSVFFGATYSDMRRMERRLEPSTAAWVCLRPPRLVGKPARGRYELSSAPTGSTITHGDLAAALIDVLDDPAVRRQALFVSN